MNTNYLKRRQVVSAGNHLNKSDSKKIKSEDIRQTSCSGMNDIFKGSEFPKACKNNIQKCFQEKTLHNCYLSTDQGNQLLKKYC